MTQYELTEKTVTLKVRKSSIFVRGIMFFFAFASFILPLTGIIIAMINGKRFHIGFLIGLFLFGLIGFYLLRISLWNTYGEETIKLRKPTIEYEANYGWFKDGKRSINFNNPVFSIDKIGYEEDKTGILVIEEGTEKIESVVKMKICEIEELIEKIKTLDNTL
ncbi:hypothetical protein [Tamlana sp. I1]|uniref:hypothetical protein n=1 Tax=Tamlana sp. I1 TaxID=2762061 RepID=UPI00188F982B|nr:hypothetical protein [Tamlana sp. I1]